MLLNSEAVKKKLSLEKILQGIVILAATALPGCYANSIRDAPQPSERKVMLDEQWKKYITDLSKYRGQDSHVGKEKDFARYNRWLAHLAGKRFDETKFVIIPNGRIGGLLSCGIGGFLAPGGIYWNRRILVREGSVSLRDVAHEFGHMYDPSLNSWDYLTDRSERCRMESVSEAFSLHAGIELIKQGNINEGAQLADIHHAPLELREDNPYCSGQYIAMVLMSDDGKMRNAWLYLATHDTRDIMHRVARIVRRKGQAEAIAEGTKKLYEERARAGAQYKEMYTESLLVSRSNK